MNDSNLTVQDIKREISFLEEKHIKICTDMYAINLLEKDNAISKAKLKVLNKKCNENRSKLKDLYLLRYKNCIHRFAKVGKSDYCCLECGLYTKYRDYEITEEIYNPKYAAMASYLRLYTIVNDRFLNLSFNSEEELEWFRATHIYYEKLDQKKKTKHRV